MINIKILREFIVFSLIKCSKCNLIRSTAPTLSANASCHTSMLS